jgi:hypothetical protein
LIPLIVLNITRLQDKVLESISELNWSVRVSSSCSTRGIRLITIVTTWEISHEWGMERVMATTNGSGVYETQIKSQYNPSVNTWRQHINTYIAVLLPEVTAMRIFNGDQLYLDNTSKQNIYIKQLNYPMIFRFYSNIYGQ